MSHNNGGTFYVMDATEEVNAASLREFLTSYAAGALPPRSGGAVATMAVAAALAGAPHAGTTSFYFGVGDEDGGGDVNPWETALSCLCCPITCPLLCAFQCCLGCCIFSTLTAAMGASVVSSGASSSAGSVCVFDRSSDARGGACACAQGVNNTARMSERAAATGKRAGKRSHRTPARRWHAPLLPHPPPEAVSWRGVAMCMRCVAKDVRRHCGATAHAASRGRSSTGAARLCCG
jgi:hypothetical protein